MDDIADLVITPFREIIEKASTAEQNAGDSQPMLSAAKTLVKGGERALKKLEPLCNRLFDEYGQNFHDALKANDDIAQHRMRLMDLLWEFDDYIELEYFDAEKFTELQAASREAAPKIYDTLIRMKLDIPDETHPLMARLPTPTSPNSQAFRTSLISASPVTQASRASSHSHGDSLSVRDSRLPDDGRLSDSHLADRPIEPAAPPPPPSTNPWEVRSTASMTDEGRHSGDFEIERRAPVAVSDSPVDPVSPFTLEADRRLSSNGGLETAEERARSSSNYSSSPPVKYNLFPSFNSQRKPLPSLPSIAQPIPEETESSPKYDSFQHENGNSPTLGHVLPIRQAPPVRSIDSEALSPTDTRRPPIAKQITSDSNYSAHTHHTRISDVSADTQPSSFMGHGSIVSPMPEHSQPGLEVSSSLQPYDGLIPVETEKESESPPQNMSPRDCSIQSGSSFYLLKGFCDGAKEVLQGGIGVKKTKKPVGFTVAATVARCTSCMCELDFKEIEQDLRKDDAANRTRCGIGYRVRFLQKSHLPAKRVDDVMYGCLFCISQGRTLDESDATVFFSPQALFAHIARHPRPLPEVSNVVVVDQAEVPTHLRNDFDIHLKTSVKPHPVLEHTAEILQQPTAISKEAARRLYGQKLLFDKTPALELAQGARITGISWPLKHNGDWCMGWHDGVYASVPFEIIRLEAPPGNQIKMDGSSQTQARARWKFVQKEKDKDKGDWLRFDKGEIITNISWTYYDHWCWSGANAKGKWGIFPQAFIDTSTITQPTALDRVNSLTAEKNKSTSIMSKFSMRKSTSSSGRPPSVSSAGTGGMRAPSLSGSSIGAMSPQSKDRSSRDAYYASGGGGAY